MIQSIVLIDPSAEGRRHRRRCLQISSWSRSIQQQPSKKYYIYVERSKEAINTGNGAGQF